MRSVLLDAGHQVVQEGKGKRCIHCLEWHPLSRNTKWTTKCRAAPLPQPTSPPHEADQSQGQRSDPAPPQSSTTASASQGDADRIKASRAIGALNDPDPLHRIPRAKRAKLMENEAAKRTKARGLLARRDAKALGAALATGPPSA